MKLLYFSTVIIITTISNNFIICSENDVDLDQKIDALTLQLQSSTIGKIHGCKDFLESDQIAQFKKRIKENEVAGTTFNSQDSENIFLFIFYDKKGLQLLVVDTAFNNESNQISPSEIQKEIEDDIQEKLTDTPTTETRINALKGVKAILGRYKVIYKAAKKELDDWVHVDNSDL